MMRWPVLWLPPILVNLFQSMASVPLSTQALQFMVLGTAYLAGFIIDAGWLAMIARALRDEAPRMADFKEGVNRYWGQLVAGHVVYLLILGATLAALAWYGDQHYGFQPLKTWYEAMMRLKPAELQAALEPTKIPVAVRGWMTLMTAWMIAVAGVTFLVLLWQPLVVLAGMSWWKAWGESVRLVFSRFFQIFGFALFHLGAFSLSLSIAASGSPFLAVAGLTFMLFVTIYFKILYAGLVAEAYPPSAEASSSPPQAP